MPSRTAEANKAIRLAWQREYDLVKEGKGTRDWTEEQQKDILDPDKGKAYDDSGRAFDGQHMKSVEEYPEYQGNPDNIQFLTRKEHLAAHKGNWQNPTNGYYDSVEKQFFEFGENGLIPCKVIELSNPVITIEAYSVDTEVGLLEQTEKEQGSGTDPPTMSSLQLTATSPSVPEFSQNTLAKQGSKGTMIDSFENVVSTVKGFSDKHPVLTTIAKVGLGLSVTVVTSKAISTRIKPNQFGRIGSGLLNSQNLKATVETAADKVNKFDFKTSESALKQLGYTVAKNKALSSADRQSILHEVVTKGEMSKEMVCAFLKNKINLHKNQSTFKEAVAKWMEDLTYTQGEL